ncbi:heat-inducible transcriptional repressor HrcA [Mycoplasmopsis glycophila]|uniref:Heat-inducible transcription repressor HrcA n=1 Tax=Mycoplasmopsis glycophila TaxID=171285 RepID=A0A449AWE4_9BACT|nr:heat-inducible transcriptional repressor HrcA [Mycoplasmopsis glycophila]VEU71011.1 heat inducible transcription repressor HrcA [Mycoplasmopsis glycophila]
MNSRKLDNKYEFILKHIVSLYIEEPKAISSSLLLQKYPEQITFSSAKIRYLMNDLEKMGYLEKCHSSSGRIPTANGLNYYANYLADSCEEQLMKQLSQIFKDKEEKIDTTIESAAKIISDATGLTLVTTSYNHNSLLKGIDIVPISDFSATIVIVISTGEVFSKILKFDPEEININDLKVAVRIFKEHLIDEPVSRLTHRVNELKDVLSQAVKNYQKIIENFVNNIFNNNFVQKNVYGKKNIILSSKINRESLSNMIELIENYSVWEHIENELENEERIKISITDSGAYMSKRIDAGDKITEISVVGSQNSNFNNMRAVLNVLEKLLKNKKE